MENKWSVNIGKRIRQLREIQGLTQRKLGEKVNKSNSTISNLEKGKRNVTLKTLEKIASALNVEVPELFNYSQGDEEMPVIIREAREKYSDIPEACLDIFTKNFYEGLSLNYPEDYYYLWIFIDAMTRGKYK